MKRTALLLSLCVVALPASGVLYVYEGFDYPAGTDNLNGQNGGTGFTAAWTLTGGAGNPNVAAGTMGYSDLAGRILLTSGNRAYFDATNPDVVTAGTNSIAFRDMNLTLALGGTLYFSLMGEQLTGDEFRLFLPAARKRCRSATARTHRRAVHSAGAHSRPGTATTELTAMFQSSTLHSWCCGLT